MTELKTLNDLKTYIEERKMEFVAVELLKKEMIKWYHSSDGNKHRFIREFLSITEEYLKIAEKTGREK